MNTEKIKQLLGSGRVYDLGMEYFVGMPHHPNHPPFGFSLTKLHGEVVYGGGVSACNCLFTMMTYYYCIPDFFLPIFLHRRCFVISLHPGSNSVFPAESA
jgi:hypothetical protein